MKTIWIFAAMTMLCALIVGCCELATAKHPITEQEARQVGAAFANNFLKDKTYVDADHAGHSYETLAPATWSRAQQKDGRWILRLDPPDGIYMSVSMSADGTDIRMVSYGFAPN
jgi:hypothetical protein